MKVSEKWLREWANPSISSKELIEQLTMAGLEVDSVTPVAADFSKIIVGEVLSVNPHSNAERLTICQVNTGSETLTIVCGAKNVKAGMKVPVAVIGAELAPDIVIRETTLRGEKSYGMLCSAKELGIAEESNGILILPQDAPLGTSVRDYLTLDDVTIEVDLTPNRADCLSIAGLAREVAVINRCAFTPLNPMPVKPLTDTTLSVLLKSPGCTHYVGRVIEGINNQVQSPLWLTEKLRRSGLRSLDPVVDVTNYVMIELGQPMHAFDYQLVKGGITVRQAKEHESLTILTGETLKLTKEDVVIADHENVLALAGIMGGEGSSINKNTTDIFLESAFFDPAIIAMRSRVHGLHTDSSHRYERGVDVNLQMKAIERATQLLTDIVGGKPGPVIEETIGELPALKKISLRLPRIKRVLGIEISPHDIEDIFTRLDMKIIQKENEIWQIQIPSARFDINIEEDLIEELARIYRYEEIPASKAVFALQVEPQSENIVPLSTFKQVLVSRDYQEVITYSFVAPKLQDLLDPSEDILNLANPISADMSIMRTSLWPGLVNAYLYNRARQQLRIRLFESGLCFHKNREDITQRLMIGALASGSALKEQWGIATKTVDFYDVKADVENLLKLSFPLIEFHYHPAEHAALHPGQSARILQAGREIGYLGLLHPRVTAALGIKEPVILFELQVEALNHKSVPKMTALSKYPSIRRDLAIIVNEKVSSGDITDCLRGQAGDLLVDITLFDVYQGPNMQPGEKSLAFALVLQHPSRTLQDEEVNTLINAIITELGTNFGARLRE